MKNILFQMWQDIENFLLAQPTPPQASPVSVCGSGTVVSAATTEPEQTSVKNETRLSDEPLAEEFVDLDMLINNAAEQHSLQYSIQLQQERALKLESEQFQQEPQSVPVKLEVEPQTLHFSVHQGRQKLDGTQFLNQESCVKLETDQDLVLHQNQNEV